MDARTSAEQGIPINGTKGYRRRVDFRVLGSIEVVENGRGPIALGGPKQRTVLAHLILRANHLVPTEVLIDQVWGEEPPRPFGTRSRPTPRTCAKRSDTKARGKRAATSFAPTQRGSMQSASSRSFAMRGASSYRREGGRGCVRSRTGSVARPCLRRSRRRDVASGPRRPGSTTKLAALEERIEAQLTLGELGEVIGELEGLTARHPLRERFWEQLMLALYRSVVRPRRWVRYRRAREL